MGAQASGIYNNCRRIVLKYNAGNRALKFLDKNQLPRAPKHRISKESGEGVTLSKEKLAEIHGKNIQLYEYLKKVYLTSTSKIIGTPSKRPRPKPKKENEMLKVALFREPEKAAPGYCTISNVIDILEKHHTDSETWNVGGLATKFELHRKDVGNLITYHSLFIKENFEYFHDKPTEYKDEESTQPKQLEFRKKFEEKPTKQISDK